MTFQQKNFKQRNASVN